MSCQFASAIDLDDFVADRSDTRFADFRTHYPTCSECSALVGSWSRIETALGQLDAADTAHPDDEGLLAYSEGRLAHEASQPIAQHLADCARCRTTVDVVGRFAPGPVVLEAPTEARTSLVDRVAAWLGGSRTPVWGAAAALGVAIAALLLVSRPQPGDVADDPGLFAQQSRPTEAPLAPGETSPDAGTRELAGTPSPAPAARPTLEAVQPGPPTTGLAETPGAFPPARVDPAPSPEPHARDVTAESIAAAAPPAESQQQLEQIAPQAQPVDSLREPVAAHVIAEKRATPPKPSADPDLAPIELGDPIFLAAHVPTGSPTYVPAAAGLALDDLGLQQIGFRTESGLPTVTALAPPHAAATRSPSPKLYWHLAGTSAAPVEVVMTAEGGLDPVLELWFEPPIESGIHVLSLEERSVQLDPRTVYVWHVSLVPDPDRRSRDVSTGGELRLVPPTPEVAAALAAAPEAERAHLLAAAGYWPDAFETLSDWVAREPTAAVLRAHRAALLRQIGLDEVAADLAD